MENKRSAISTKNLVKVYGKKKVVKEISIQLEQGEIVGLLGPNGAGKTTTFHMMIGLKKATSGRVFLDDEEITHMPMFKRARLGLSYLSQEPSVFSKLTVRDNVKAIIENLDIDKDEQKKRLKQALDDLDLARLSDQKAYSLSGGERRKLEITRALVTEPKFLF